ncbi:MAG: hypothetical protein IPL53_19165 [Ignavibacteria bacterium]|nr:hypothetical protein [Ignavibacteria bacterium]
MIVNIRVQNIISSRLRNSLISCLLFAYFAIPTTSYSQADTIAGRTIPVTAITEFIKYSNATARNNLFYPGKINGFLNGNSTFLKDFESQETFTFEIGNYDSIQFFFDLPKSYVDKFFIKVLENQPFEYKTSPIMQLSGADLIEANNQMQNLFLTNGTGKKLYAVTITDDVNANWVKVEPLPEASLYIDVVKLDSSTYHIQIKNKAIFLGNLSEDIKNKWSRGEEIKFPIGIIMTDTMVPSPPVPINYTLVKKKKPKKINN